MSSPLQYGYRTKLTPHFDRLPKAKMADTVLDGSRPDWFKIGFNGSGTRTVIDIEVRFFLLSILSVSYIFIFRNAQSQCQP